MTIVISTSFALVKCEATQLHNQEDFLIEKEKTIFHVAVEIKNVIIYDDNDWPDKGEIYCYSVINNNIHRTKIIEEVDNGDIISFNEIIYNGWCYELDIFVEVFDSDSGVHLEDDSLGFISEIRNPTNLTIIELTDKNEALIEIGIIVYDISSVNTSLKSVLLLSFSLSFIVLLRFLLTSLKIRKNRVE